MRFLESATKLLDFLVLLGQNLFQFQHGGGIVVLSRLSVQRGHCVLHIRAGVEIYRVVVVGWLCCASGTRQGVWQGGKLLRVGRLLGNAEVEVAGGRVLVSGRFVLKLLKTLAGHHQIVLRDLSEVQWQVDDSLLRFGFFVHGW